MLILRNFLPVIAAGLHLPRAVIRVGAAREFFIGGQAVAAIGAGNLRGFFEAKP